MRYEGPDDYDMLKCLRWFLSSILRDLPAFGTCSRGQSAILQRDYVDLSKGEEPSSAGSRSVRIISKIPDIAFVWLWESLHVTATKKTSVHYIMQNPVN